MRVQIRKLFLKLFMESIAVAFGAAVLVVVCGRVGVRFDDRRYTPSCLLSCSYLRLVRNYDLCYCLCLCMCLCYAAMLLC